MGQELAGHTLDQGGQAAGSDGQQAAVPQGPPGHGLRPLGEGKAPYGAPVFVSLATSMKSVLIHPGHTAVTRMPRGAASQRRARLYRSRNALVAA